MPARERVKNYFQTVEAEEKLKIHFFFTIFCYFFLPTQGTQPPSKVTYFEN